MRPVTRRTNTLEAHPLVSTAMPRSSLLAFSLAVALSPAVALAQATQGGDLGVPLPLFPADNSWNTDISKAPLDPRSATFISFIGGAGRKLHPDFGGYANPGQTDEIYGFPYVVITSSNDLSLQTVQFDYADESDGVDHNNNDTPFPFYPIPPAAKTDPYWIEGGPSGDSDPKTVPGADGDRHMLIVDK